MICKYCGNALESESSFCPKCGKKVSKEEKGTLVYELTCESKKSGANAILALLVLCGVICGACIAYLAYPWIKIGAIFVGIVIAAFFIYDAVMRSKFQRATELRIYEGNVEGVCCPFNRLLMLSANTQHFSCDRADVKQVEIQRGAVIRILVNEKSYCIHAGNKNEAQKIKSILEGR